MRDFALDEIAVGPEQPGHFDVPIVDGELEPLSNQSLDKSDHRAFPEVIGTSLEAHSENTDAFTTGLQNEFHRLIQLASIADEDRIEKRRIEVQLFGLVGYGPEVFWQAGSSERKPGHHVGWRNV